MILRYLFAQSQIYEAAMISNNTGDLADCKILNTVYITQIISIFITYI